MTQKCIGKGCRNKPQLIFFEDNMQEIPYCVSHWNGRINLDSMKLCMNKKKQEKLKNAS